MPPPSARSGRSLEMPGKSAASKPSVIIPAVQ